MARQGWAFRNTSGYVSDASGDNYVLPTDGYPTVRGGQNTGWVTNNPDGGDNQNTTYPKIAGINYRQNSQSGTRDWRVDITGAKKVRLAMGHWSNAQNNYVDVRDSGGSKFSLSNAPSSAGGTADATGASLTMANWISSNTQSAEYTFADYVEVRIGGNGSGANYSCLMYFETDDSAAAGMLNRYAWMGGIGRPIGAMTGGIHG